METPARRNAAEARPIRLAVPPPHEELAPMETITITTAPALCPRGCGKAAGHMGRCPKHGLAATQPSRPRPEPTPRPEPIEPGPVASPPAVRPGPILVLPEGMDQRPADPELAALAALLSLSPAAMGRVIRYASERMEEVAGG